MPAPKEQSPQQPPPNRYVRTRRDHRTELTEDYLELIGQLIEERGEARAVDIARRLGVSHVTVSRAVSRLQEAGLVESKPYRSIFLTEAGCAIACRSRQRHQTVLEFLLTVGVPREVAMLDAEGIEHHVSNQTLEIMRAYSKKRRRR